MELDAASSYPSPPQKLAYAMVGNYNGASRHQLAGYVASRCPIDSSNPYQAPAITTVRVRTKTNYHRIFMFAVAVVCFVLATGQFAAAAALRQQLIQSSLSSNPLTFVEFVRHPVLGLLLVAVGFCCVLCGRETPHGAT